MFVFIFLFSAYAFAELIDNALAATAENEGPRNIEIRLVSFAILSLILSKHLLMSVSCALSAGFQILLIKHN